jgi:hypothetical protein
MPVLATYNASKLGSRVLFLHEPPVDMRIRKNLIAAWMMDKPMAQQDITIFGTVDQPVGKSRISCGSWRII